jgi:hypothetical protein
MPYDDELPGRGQFHCVVTGKHFMDARAFTQNISFLQAETQGTQRDPALLQVRLVRSLRKLMTAKSKCLQRLRLCYPPAAPLLRVAPWVEEERCRPLLPVTLECHKCMTFSQTSCVERVLSESPSHGDLTRTWDVGRAHRQVARLSKFTSLIHFRAAEIQSFLHHVRLPVLNDYHLILYLIGESLAFSRRTVLLAFFRDSIKSRLW